MNRFRFGIIALFAWGSFLGSIFAQQREIMAPKPAAYVLPEGVHEVRVPFKLINNHVLVPVSINGSGPFDFILDTGMRDPAGVLAWDGKWLKEASLKLAEGAQVPISGAGKDQEPIMATIAPGISIGIGEIALPDAHVIVIPPMPMPLKYYQGVIGDVLFSNFVIMIDYDNMTLTLTEPQYFSSPKLWTRISLSVQNGFPYVSGLLSINGIENIPVNLVVDLGASHPVSLNIDAASQITVPSTRLTTQIGRGVSGALSGYVARIDAFSLGGLTLTDVVATFPDSPDQIPGGANGRSGNLGNGFLHHFNVIIDYANKRMFLKPNKKFDEPFEWRMTGMVFGDSVADGIVISEVDDASPAKEVGIQAADVLRAVNGKDIFNYQLEELMSLMRVDGQRLELKIERGDEILSVSLTTRRLI